MTPERRREIERFNKIIPGLTFPWEPMIRDLLDEIDRLNAAIEKGPVPAWLRPDLDALDRLKCEASEYEFADLPAWCRHALIWGGYLHRAQVARATDAELLRCRNLGKRSLAVIRAAIPQACNSECNSERCESE